jgi:hypothetical protein
MTNWRSAWHLEDHFVEHGRELGCRTLASYDVSAQETLTLGRFFTYFHEDAGEERTGCYDLATERLVVLNADDQIVTHFRCEEWYVRNLPDSTYDSGKDRH